MFLTQSELAGIKKLLAKEITPSVIALKYDISKAAVLAIKHNRPYIHLL